MYSAVISTEGRNPINQTVISIREPASYAGRNPTNKTVISTRGPAPFAGRNPMYSAVSNIITTLIAFKSLPAWHVGFFCQDIFGNKTSQFHCISYLSGIICSLKKEKSVLDRYDISILRCYTVFFMEASAFLLTAIFF